MLFNKKLEKWNDSWGKELYYNSRRLGVWVEKAHPKLLKPYLHYATSLLEPFFIGSGLREEKISEEGIELMIPRKWRNLGRHGNIHLGAAQGLAELTWRYYWERYLDFDIYNLTIQETHLKVSEHFNENLYAKYWLSGMNRDQMIFQLHSQGFLETLVEVPLFFSNGRNVGQADFKVYIKGRMAIDGE